MLPPLSSSISLHKGGHLGYSDWFIWPFEGVKRVGKPFCNICLTIFHRKSVRQIDRHLMKKQTKNLPKTSLKLFPKKQELQINQSGYDAITSGLDEEMITHDANRQTMEERQIIAINREEIVFADSDSEISASANDSESESSSSEVASTASGAVRIGIAQQNPCVALISPKQEIIWANSHFQLIVGASDRHESRAIHLSKDLFADEQQAYQFTCKFEETINDVFASGRSRSFCARNIKAHLMRGSRRSEDSYIFTLFLV